MNKCHQCGVEKTKENTDFNPNSGLFKFECRECNSKKNERVRKRKAEERRAKREMREKMIKPLDDFELDMATEKYVKSLEKKHSQTYSYNSWGTIV